ncbi:Dam family site-specific DNA-(adenine-N6)-methyltransferase [Leclercia adecarboxylata]|uniref:Dam family site-specific DNA-(adenine-N6)-methyltransferase n=1 Tax=Leclercia adecarboxylata TaxID=83655 RepID=UPI00159BBAAD|nr:Dam family site-specific DNA-(adenine-N6)-methyltransferase [Leclercia adecarboxylata]
MHQLSYGSVCSGIEAASVAWETLGLNPAWFAEIEKFPSAVLAHHWPHITNLGDMTKIAAAIRAGKVEAPDILVGGTPCQAFSIAGLRKGLSDARGQLTLAFVELANAIDDVRKAAGKPPCIIVWENVPGVLTSQDNAFGNFIAGLAGADEAIEPGSRPKPGKNSKFWRWRKSTGQHAPKWANAGGAYGQQRAVAWRILNAQHFGVAQRRRRCFVIASSRKGFDPLKILAEFDGVRRDITPRSQPGEIASTLTKNGVGVVGADDNQAQAGHLIPAAYGGGNTAGAINVSTTLTTSNQRIDFDTETLITFPAHMSGTQFQSGNGKASQTIQAHNPTAVCMTDSLMVRRLMPLECERLQGFPESHTDIPYKGKPAQDGPRYRAIGNSMAVPVMRWIMTRIKSTLSENQWTENMTETATPARTRASKKNASEKPDRNKPFLKWAGGKFSQLDQIMPFIGTGERLIEPFVGAGSIFLNATGFNRYLLSDTSTDLINLYLALQAEPARVIEKARLMFASGNSNDAFLDIRSRFNGIRYTPHERAAAFLYINRHSFNGLMRYNLKGEYNVGFGKYKAPYFPNDELVGFASLAQRCEFVCRSFVDTIRLAGKGDVVFCDPPYMSLPDTSGFTQYTTVPFTDEHQWQLLNEMVAAHQRGARVIVTNSAHPELIEAYKKAGFKIHDLFARRSMSCKGDKRKVAVDIMGVLG